MNIKKMENINVYNYGSNVVIISTRDKEFTLKPAINGIPSMIPMTWNEIDYFNSNSNAIRNGIVRFTKDIEADVYNGLRITNWKEILFEDVIEDIVLFPTLEKLQRIVDVRNIAVIERVKGVLTLLKNAGKDISVRVDKIVNTRYREVSHNKLKTSIILSPKDTAISSVVAEDVTGLKAENMAMKNEIANMKSMIAELLENKNSANTNNESSGNTVTETKMESTDKSLKSDK